MRTSNYSPVAAFANYKGFVEYSINNEGGKTTKKNPVRDGGEGRKESEISRCTLPKIWATVLREREQVGVIGVQRFYKTKNASVQS